MRRAAFLAALLFGCERSEAGGTAVSVEPPSPPPKTSAVPRAPKPSFEQMVKQSQPLAPKPEPQKARGREVRAELCRIEGKQFLGKSTMDVFKAVEALADRLVVVDSRGVLHGFSVRKGEGCTLEPDAGFGTAGVLQLPHKVENLSRDERGRLFASNGIFAAYVVKDGKQELVCDTKGQIEIHRSGKWGIAPYVNATVRLVEVEKETCTSEDWVLSDLSDDQKRKGPFANVTSAAVVGDVVWIGGVVAKKDAPAQPRIVVGYSKAGKEKVRFGADADPEAQFGWVHAIESCGQNLCVLDANRRRVSVWTRTGKHVAAVSLPELFGVAHPWVPDFTVAKDGSAWFVVAQNRGKSGVTEGLIYRVRGL